MIENQNAVADGEQSPQDANLENSSSSNANQGNEQPANGAVKSGDTQTPFHKNPEFQDYLGRQKKSWDRDWNNRLSEMQATYDKKFSDLQASFSNRSGQPLSDQDASQLRQLAKLIQSDPEAAKILGLDSVKTLQERLDRFESSSSESAIEREANSAVQEYATKYGYEPKQLEQEVWEFIKDDDYWANQPFSKGIFTKAMRDFFSDKQQELAERAANMKLVTENKNKNRAGSQKPLGNAQNTTPNAPKTMREAINQSMEGMKKEGVLFG